MLAHAYPRADIPVVQLIIDASQARQFHYDIGCRLPPLREEGVLIIGSGNLVHNLRAFQWGQPEARYDWAMDFEARARELLLSGHSRL